MVALLPMPPRRAVCGRRSLRSVSEGRGVVWSSLTAWHGGVCSASGSVCDMRDAVLEPKWSKCQISVRVSVGWLFDLDFSADSLFA